MKVRDIKPPLTNVSKWRKRNWYADSIVLMHGKRAIAVYCFLTIGAVISPSFSLTKLLLSFIGMFGVLNLTAYSLDELKGRHCATCITSKELFYRSIIGLIIALIIAGIAITYRRKFDWVLLMFVIIGAFFAVAYNFEVLGGKFHTMFLFGLSWGFCPLVASTWFHGGGITLASITFGIFASMYGWAHVIHYGNTKCHCVETCKEVVSVPYKIWDNYFKPQMVIIKWADGCHGGQCGMRLVMPKVVSKLQWRIINFHVWQLIMITIAIVILRVR